MDYVAGHIQKLLFILMQGVLYLLYLKLGNYWLEFPNVAITNLTN